MTKTYETTITIDTDYGIWEDVPCVVEYTAEFQLSDPAIGEFHNQWSAQAKVKSVTLNEGTFFRGLLSGFLGKKELARQEDLIAEKIASELDTGDLEYA